MPTLAANEFHEFFANNKVAKRQIDVYEFFKDNPSATVKECAECLGVSYGRAYDLVKKTERQKGAWEIKGKPSRVTTNEKTEKFTNRHLIELMNLLVNENLSEKSSELVSIYHKQFKF